MIAWYYINNGQQIGPIDESQIRALVTNGHITGEDLVWREGMPQWMRAADAGLKKGAAPPPPPPPPPPRAIPAAKRSPIAPVGVTAEEYARQPITLTPRAAETILKVYREQKLPAHSFLRVGCNQSMGVFRYDLDIQEQPGPPDSDFENVSHGVRLVVARRLTPYLKGCKIDFGEKEGGNGFIISNPNATGK